MGTIRKGYKNTSLGQIHMRLLDADGGESYPPLVCLHPAPSSGLYFKTVMPLLSTGRRVIAPDYPGYGGSDALSEPPAVEDYAGAMFELVAELSDSGPVDVLGFHTGCLVGAELALQQPEKIRRLLLCDVPYFTAEIRSGLKKRMSVPLPISPEVSSIESAWAFNVSNRINDVPLERTFELFAEQLRAGSHDYFAFEAAFRYPCEDRLPRIKVDTTVLATQSALHGPSVEAASVIPGATFVDVTEVTTAVFEAGANAISLRVNAALV